MEEDRKKMLTGVISQEQRDYGWFYFNSHTFLGPRCKWSFLFFLVNVYYFLFSKFILFSKCILLLQSEENNKYYFKQEEIKSR